MKRISWYIHRLRVMPPAELVHRVVHLVHSQRLRRIGAPALLRHVEPPPRARVALSFDDAIVDLLSQFKETWLALAEKAKSPRCHTFSFLGAPERDFGAHQIDWHCDPLTGKRWPSTTAAWKINHRESRDLGEVKYVWELGRMPWLIPWSLAARVLGDSPLARLALDDILSFVRANPPYFGIHWTSGIELGVRVVAWTWTLALIAPLVTLTTEEWAEIGRYVALAADYCRRFLSLYSSANNHLIAEGAALEIAGTAWPWLPQAKEFATLGRRILNAEIPRQVLPDGSSIEMCPAYLREVLLWSAAVARVRCENAVEIPATWRERWTASASFLDWLCGREQCFPPLGDDDEGEVLPTGVHESPGILVELLRVLGQGVPATACPLSPLALLLLPPDKLRERSSIASTPQMRQDNSVSPSCPSILMVSYGGTFGETRVELPLQGARFFSDSGLAVIRSEKLRLIADFGPHGMPPLYAHAHADALSLILDYDNQPILLDPGTYCYHGERKWRDYFRSTRAHNTLCIDDRDQSEMKGPFLWGHVARTRVTHVQCSFPAMFAAEHDGYAPFVHRRTLRQLGPFEFLVEDELFFDAQKRALRFQRPYPPVFQWWHFAPSQLEIGQHELSWKSSACRLIMRIDASAPYKMSRHEGELTPIQGWFSPRFSVKFPSPAVGIRVDEWHPPLVIRTHIHVIPPRS